jgi:hypothetical protein
MCIEEQHKVAGQFLVAFIPVVDRLPGVLP